jgi:hypothetical protein
MRPQIYFVYKILQENNKTWKVIQGRTAKNFIFSVLKKKTTLCVHGEYAKRRK